MATFYYAQKANGDYLYDNFPKETKNLIADFKESQQTITVTIDGVAKEGRIGRKRTNSGTIYTLTTDQKYINRYKFFKELVQVSDIALAPLVAFYDKMISEYNEQTQQFIHNVTSLNSYGIQDLYILIPQKILTENVNKQRTIVKERIAENPDAAVKTLLKMIKYSLAMKVEFSVFERILKPYSNTWKIPFLIRDIVLSVLQIFMEDFDERKIIVHLDACEKRLNIDHDSLFVSLYYIFDNSIKYCCRDTDYKIIFREESDAFSILFNMISIKIENDEVDKLTVMGYRSERAKKTVQAGNGIGMYRILRTLKFNDAELIVTPRFNTYTRTRGEIEYEGNQFKIRFIGQHDWFG